MKCQGQRCRYDQRSFSHITFKNRSTTHKNRLIMGKEKIEQPTEETLYVNVKELPSYSKLNGEVQKIAQNSSAWDLYGADWLLIFCWGFLLFPVGLYLLNSDVMSLSFCCGILALGCCHAIYFAKGSHLAAHRCLSTNSTFNRFLEIVFGEFLGSYSSKMGSETHIKVHHPYTNIIGLGDSSSWKVPMLPGKVYMFFAPLMLPALTPLIAVGQLWGRWKDLACMVPVVAAGISTVAALLVHCSGFSYCTALLCMCVYRATFMIPYIHINIFQHIGLKMYSQENRPKRIFQMSTGVLNLSRNLILDYVFGHSLISCHIEHHLFPNLSDNMCLKVKPLVSQFFKENNLQYNEAEYGERLATFVRRYKELMVHAPPITHFVGIQ